MILGKYIIKKFCIAMIITGFSFFTLFYIGSLIDNLILDLSFTRITLITLLDSISVIVIIPEIIFFFSVLLFSLIIRASNELLLIRHYLSKKKITLFFMIFVLLSFLININKTLILDTIDLTKYNISNSGDEKIIKNKLLVDFNKNKKTLYELSNIDLKNHNINKIKIHNFENNNHIETLVSNNVKYSSDEIYIDKYTIITEGNIYKSSIRKTYNVNLFEKNLLSNEKVKYIKSTYKNNFFKNNLFKSINFILLLLIVSSLFIGRSLIKGNFIFILYVFLGLLLIIYSFILNFIDVKYFQILFNVSGTLVFSYTLFYAYNND